MRDGGSIESEYKAIRKATKLKPWFQKPIVENLPEGAISDLWPSDNIFDYTVGKRSSESRYFHELLEQEEVTDFQPLLEKRKANGQTTHVLELFGSGNFIDDLSVADSITGVRLKDNTQEVIRYFQKKLERWSGEKEYTDTVNHLHEMVASPKWTIIEGNLYRSSTWIKLKKHQIAKGIPSFDLITVLPIAAFSDYHIFGEKDWQWNSTLTPHERVLKYGPTFLRLLARTYESLSFNEGKLFAEVPDFVQAENFIDTLQTVGEQEGGVKVDVSNQGKWTTKTRVKITKFPNSTPDIGGLIAAKFSTSAVK